MRRFVSALVLSLMALLAATPGGAADGVPSPLGGYSLTSWAQKDGISSPLIWALTQDRVGYLWLGTDAGILRFDGVRFVPWDELAPIPNPRASVRALCATRDGALWFGIGEPGGIGVLRNGAVRMYRDTDGLPAGVVMALVESPDGVLWAVGRFGAFRLVRDRWERSDDGLPPGMVNALVIDPDGALYAATADGVFIRAARAARFTKVGESSEPARDVTRGHGNRLWVTDPIIGFRDAISGRALALDAQRARGSRLKYDSRGNLWVGTGGQGLWRFQHHVAGEVRRFERASTTTGLSDDGVTDLHEDREGNIWVATRDGLNRLTPHKMMPIMGLGTVSAVDATADGRVWVGTADSVVAFAQRSLTALAPPIEIPNPPLAAMHADGRGTLWVATAGALLRIVNGRREVVPLKGAALHDLTDIASDGSGGLWLHDGAAGLWRWRRGLLEPAPIPAALQPVPLLASYTDRDGGAWFAYQNGRVARIDQSGGVQVFGAEEGLSAGPYRSIHQDPAGTIWFGGNRGLSRFQHGTFRTLPGLSNLPPLPITGIADDQDGHLWLAMEGAGLVRLSGHEIARALADPSHRLSYRAYDKADGSAGTSRWFGSRAAVRAGDGRLWFVAGRGVTVVDPDALKDEALPVAAVRIESALVDGRRVAPGSTQVLPPRTARLQVDYTVLNLTSPLKTGFRHKLEGFDADWIDAGTAHSASYTNLPPRGYVFRVMATGADGTFGEPAAEWRFRIQPTFYQTWWFVGLGLTAIGASIALSWRVHALRVRRQFALLLGERARLSREVHDTLLQSMFGFALQVDALGAAVPTSAPELRGKLANLRHQVEEDIREARQSIWNLRSPRLAVRDLAGTLRDAAALAAGSAGIRPVIDVTGVPRRATPHVEEQLLRIGREAMSNVLRHAQAHEMRVLLHYNASSITLQIVDDGSGFESSGRPVPMGHFGLTTMRERAESAGGTLAIDSRVGAGTTVTAVIPDP